MNVSAQHLEIEAKFAVADHVDLRRRLEAAGGQYIGRAQESNRFFDRPDGALRDAGCGLRVRAIRAIDGPPRAATITFKGPRQPGELKIRPEHEVEVSDADAAAELLAHLGFVEFFRFEKRRETWKLDDCRVELDEVPRLGLFVEIEGPNEAAVQRARRALALDKADLIHESYLALLMRHRDAHAPGAFAFT
jgi:adenylate cyclase class 2